MKLKIDMTNSADCYVGGLGLLCRRNLEYKEILEYKETS